LPPAAIAGAAILKLCRSVRHYHRPAARMPSYGAAAVSDSPLQSIQLEYRTVLVRPADSGGCSTPV